MAKSNSFRIEAVDKAVFKDCLQIGITTTMELSNAVNAFFSVYEDFIGSFLDVVPASPNLPCVIRPILRFKVFPSNAHEYMVKRTPVLDGDGKQVKDSNGIPVFDVEYPTNSKSDPIYTAFTPYDASEKNGDAFAKRSMSAEIEKIRRISSTGSSGNPQAQVHYTTEGKYGLEPFMRKNANRQVEWDKNFNVQVSPTGDTIISVYGLDINVLCSEIYGNRDDRGGRITYSVTPIKPLAQMTMQTGATWSVQMIRTLESNMNDAAQLTGAVSTSYGVPMTRVIRTA